MIWVRATWASNKMILKKNLKRGMVISLDIHVQRGRDKEGMEDLEVEERGLEAKIAVEEEEVPKIPAMSKVSVNCERLCYEALVQPSPLHMLPTCDWSVRCG